MPLRPPRRTCCPEIDDSGRVPRPQRASYWHRLAIAANYGDRRIAAAGAPPIGRQAGVSAGDPSKAVRSTGKSTLTKPRRCGCKSQTRNKVWVCQCSQLNGHSVDAPGCQMAPTTPPCCPGASHAVKMAHVGRARDHWRKRADSDLNFVEFFLVGTRQMNYSDRQNSDNSITGP